MIITWSKSMSTIWSQLMWEFCSFSHKNLLKTDFPKTLLRKKLFFSTEDASIIEKCYMSHWSMLVIFSPILMTLSALTSVHWVKFKIYTKFCKKNNTWIKFNSFNPSWNMVGEILVFLTKTSWNRTFPWRC